MVEEIGAEATEQQLKDFVLKTLKSGKVRTLCQA